MPSLRFVEFLLSLVMPAERAAATAGDLAESSPGTLSLWLAVVRTWLGTVFHQTCADPKGVGCGALMVTVVNMAAGAALTFAVLVGILALESFESVRRMSLTPYIAATDVLNALLVSFFLGRYMLRRYGPKAIAVWAGTMIVRLLLLRAVALGLRTLSVDNWNGPFPTETLAIAGLVGCVGGSLQMLIGIAYEHRCTRKMSLA